MNLSEIFMSKHRYKFDVTLLTEQLLEVSFSKGVMLVKVRQLDGGSFSATSKRSEIKEHRCRFNLKCKFVCKMYSTHSTAVLGACKVRVSVRMEEKDGGFRKLGYVDIDLAEYAGSGICVYRSILKPYRRSSHRLDNSILQMSVSVVLRDGDTVFIRSDSERHFIKSKANEMQQQNDEIERNGGISRLVDDIEAACDRPVLFDNTNDSEEHWEMAAGELVVPDLFSISSSLKLSGFIQEQQHRVGEYGSIKAELSDWRGSGENDFMQLQSTSTPFRSAAPTRTTFLGVKSKPNAPPYDTESMSSFSSSVTSGAVSNQNNLGPVASRGPKSTISRVTPRANGPPNDLETLMLKIKSSNARSIPTDTISDMVISYFEQQVKSGVGVAPPMGRISPVRQTIFVGNQDRDASYCLEDAENVVYDILQDELG